MHVDSGTQMQQIPGRRAAPPGSYVSRGLAAMYSSVDGKPASDTCQLMRAQGRGLAHVQQHAGCHIPA